MEKLLAAALKYRKNGLCAIPTKDDKRSFAKWEHLQNDLISEDELKRLFGDPRAACLAIITGKSSGNLEVIDIDTKYDITGTLYQRYCDAIQENAPQLFDRLLIIQTQSGGYHLYYRCPVIERNQKLARRGTTPEEQAVDPMDKVKVLIETRGQAGYVLAPPSPGYKTIQGKNVPTITEDERDVLHSLARSFNELYEEPAKPHKASSHNPKEFGVSPFDDYNKRGDITELLVRHGWTVVRDTSSRVVYRRPGKTEGTSANLLKEKNWFSVFSTSTVFETQKAYLPYAVYCVLECGGDYSACAKKLLDHGYGERRVYFGEKLERDLYKKKQEGMSDDALVQYLVVQEKKTEIDAVEIVEKLNSVWGDRICTFWDVSPKGSVSINRNRLMNFLHTTGGFSLYYYDRNSTIFRVVKCKDGLVEEVSSEHLKKFLKEYIDSLPDTFDGGVTSGDLMELILKGATTFFSDSVLEFLERSNLDFLQDTATEAFFPFRNGCIVVSREGLALKSYSEIKKVIWKSQVIDFDIFIEKDLPVPEFAEFLNLVSGNSEERYGYAVTLIGYILHKYKDLSKTHAVILAEENEDESKGGGTGKGLFVTALSKLINTQRVDGKNFKMDKSFAFQRIDLDTKLVVIEDARKNVDFESFYTVITEGVTVEKKNKDELFISYKDAPKFIFTTNYMIGGVADHAKRRQLVFEFANFFNSSNTPVMHFKHLFFEDWDRDEWNRFYNFLFLCVQGYLENGIRSVATTERVKRKYIKVKYGEEFMDWWDGYSSNGCEEFKNASDIYTQFLNSSSLEKRDYTQTRFGRAMSEAAKTLYGDIVKRRNRQGGNEVQIKLQKASENGQG